MITQKELYDYLTANTFNTKVKVGDVEDLNGDDYIFLDYLTDELIGSDNKGCYLTNIQITICTKDFTKRLQLAKYIKDKFNVQITYDNSSQFGYYLARCKTGVLIG